MNEPHPCDSDAAGADWWQNQQRLEEEMWLADQAAQAQYLEWLDQLERNTNMPKLHEMLSSKFLKKEDVDPAVLWTISGVEQLNVSQEGQPPELKWCMHFVEADKPLVLNSTNLQLLAQALHSDDSDDWIGKKIVLFNDPNVSYAGKLTGGIRLRAPRNKVATPAGAERSVAAMKAQAPTNVDQFDEEPPF